MNKKLKGEGRGREGEMGAEREVGRRAEGEGERRGGEGRKRSQRTHPLFVYQTCLQLTVQ